MPRNRLPVDIILFIYHFCGGQLCISGVLMVKSRMSVLIMKSGSPIKLKYLCISEFTLGINRSVATGGKRRIFPIKTA